MHETKLVPSREEIWKMFSQISSTYDRVNQLMTFGLDRRWRRKVSEHLPKGNNLKVLDLATGTGDQIIALLERSSRIRKIVGVDLSHEMLEIGRLKMKKKPYAHKVSLKTASALELPFRDESFDVVTISFGIRNMTDVLQALSEAKRVLKPKGRLLILEGSIPKHKIMRRCHLFYLRYLLPWIGGIVSKQKKAYQYLNETIETFPSGNGFLDLLRTAGFSHVRARPLTGGVVSIYSGEKDAL